LGSHCYYQLVVNLIAAWYSLDPILFMVCIAWYTELYVVLSLDSPLCQWCVIYMLQFKVCRSSWWHLCW